MVTFRPSGRAESVATFTLAAADVSDAGKECIAIELSGHAVHLECE